MTLINTRRRPSGIDKVGEMSWGTHFCMFYETSEDLLGILIELTLFRIVQEALANIRKHAHARHVTITLAKEEARVVLSVQDDGVGFEMQTNRSRASGDMVINRGLVIPAGHFGLIGIQEQVTALGGAFQIRSAPDEGTTIRVELPL